MNYIQIRDFNNLPSDIALEEDSTRKNFVYAPIPSSTSIKPENYQMDKELAEILLKASEEDLFEEDPLILIEIKKWIEKYSSNAISHLSYYIEHRFESLYFKSLILEMLGSIDDTKSLNERRCLLEYYAQDKIYPQLQYGAIVGLANLSSINSLNMLKKIQISAERPLLKNTLDTTIKYLANQ